MVEARLSPALYGMTELTPGLGDIPVNLALVGVFVANEAAGISELETYGLHRVRELGFGVAGVAGDSQMASGEGIAGAGVLLERESGRFKSRHRVAFLAGSFALPSCELAAVIVAVAVLAPVEYKALERFSRQMAPVASHRRMLAIQCEFRFGVIELGPVDALPAGRIVTALAVLAESIVMGILMAVEASTEFQARKSLEFLVACETVVNDTLVAFLAEHRFMLAGQ
jgi:hypothetical protein